MKNLKLLVLLSCVAVVSLLPSSVSKAGYEVNGTSISMKAPKGATSMTNSKNEIYVFDANGNTVMKQTASGYLIDYTYDAAGNNVSTVEHKYDGRPWGTTVKVYDATGKVTSELDATGATVYTYTYDGNTVTKTEAEFPHESYVYTYDAAGRLLSYEESGVTYTYVYDAAGNMTNLTYDAGYYVLHKDFTYDAKGNIATEHRYDTDGGDGTYIYTNVYDAAGRLTIVDDGDGNIMQIAY